MKTQCCYHSHRYYVPESNFLHMHMHLPFCFYKVRLQWDCQGVKRMVTFVKISDDGTLLQIWEKNENKVVEY